MFKGCLELVTPESVSGWIWCEIASLRGCTILAFVDGRCIGSGAVAGFRPDLYDAGLGDGECGFSFAIALPTGTDPSSVYIRLENSDFSLFQNRSDPTLHAANARPPWHNSSIAWMLRRGWLCQEEAAFLNAMEEVGAAVIALPATAPGKSLTRWSADRLSLLLQREVDVRQERVSRVAMDEILSKQQTAIACLLPQGTYGRKVLEGSHLGSQPPHEQPAVVYRVGPHQALFLDRRCVSDPIIDTMPCDIDVIETASWSTI